MLPGGFFLSCDMATFSEIVQREILKVMHIPTKNTYLQINAQISVPAHIGCAWSTGVSSKRIKCSSTSVL